jgi:glycosyltransferase involved in cell wall biosynthesis
VSFSNRRLLAVYSSGDLLGGGEFSFTLSVQAIQRSGWQVLAMVPRAGQLSEYLASAGIPFVTAPQDTLRSGLTARYLLQPHPKWLSITRDFRPDIIHCNSVRTALYGQAVGHRLSIPTIFHARIMQRERLADPFLIRRTQAVICTSEAVRVRFSRWIASKTLFVLYNAIDPNFPALPSARSLELRTQWLGDSGTHVVGVIGRLSPDKGQSLIIEAAQDVAKQIPGARFVFLGDEDPSHRGYTAVLKSMIDSRGLKSRFVFAGFHAPIGDAYHALDIIAFPTAAEGFGRVAIEAGVARKALVASDIRGLREIIPPAAANVLLPRNAGAFAERIIRLLQDRPYRDEIAQALHDHVMKEFSIEKHRLRLLEIYDDVLHRR